MAHIFPNGIEESTDGDDQVGCIVDFRPEQFKITLFQNVSQKDDVVDGLILHLGGQQKTLAECKVGVWEIGQRLQQNQVSDFHVQQIWIELVQFQHSQICLQVVGVFLHLLFDVVLDGFQMLGIVPEVGKNVGKF